jgi:cyclophilin family peptidyl-prolyl cis-trans isomerase
MKKSRFAVFACSIILLLAAYSTPAWSQQAAEKPNPEVIKNATTLEEVVAELSKLGPKNKAFLDVMMLSRNVEAKVEPLATEYQTATPERKVQIKEEFDKLAPEVEKYRKDMINAAVDAFSEAPYDNFIVAEFCIDMIQYEIGRDNYEVAFQLADTILSHPEGLTAQAGGLYVLAADAAFGCMQFDKAEQWYAKAVSLQAQMPRQSAGYQSDLAEQKKLWAEELAVRTKEAQDNNLPRVLIKTSKGDITLELFEDHAPNTVANFISLVKKGFYKDVPFHRVLPGFMAQGGDPTGSGSGGPGYAIDCECNATPGKPVPRKHFRGVISMANAGPNTNGSQFFLMFGPVTHLNGRHTVFGRIVEGMDVLADLQRIDPQNPTPGIVPDKIIEATVLRDRGKNYEPVKNNNRR